MTHTPLKITDEQRDNLLFLAECLDTGVTVRPFDMGFYQEFDEQGCGTSACAAGHGPLIGIKKFPEEDWEDYVDRAFTGSSYGLWDFLFGPAWGSFDNTPRGAAARIYYALEHGIPDGVWQADWVNCYIVKLQPRYTIEELAPKIQARLEESQ